MPSLKRAIWPAFIVATLVSLVLFLPALKLLWTDEEAIYEEAQRELATGDPVRAEAAARQLVELRPGSGEAYLLLAKTEIAQHDGKAAIAALDTAHEAGVPGERLHAHLGAARFLAGDLAGADEALNAKVAREDLGLANRLLARLAIDRGELKKARAILDLAHEFAPNDAELWADYAVYFDKVGNRAMAMRAIRQSLRYDPDNLRGLEIAGPLISEKSGPEAGLPYYEQGLDRAPDDLALLESKAKALATAGRYREMLSVTQHMLSVSPDHAGAHYLLAWLAASAGRPALAQSLLEDTDGQLDTMPAFMLLSGIAEYQLQSYNAAAEYFGKLVRSSPDNATARKLLASSLLKSSDPVAAYEAVEPLLADNGGDRLTRRLAAAAKRQIN